MVEPVAREFSFIVQPSAIAAAARPSVFELEASPAECEALARRFGFVAIGCFRASLSVRPMRGGEGGLRLQGRLRARVTQSCVVTLEPVVSDIDERFETLLLDEAAGTGMALDPEEDIDLYSGDAVDIGEIAAEELALSVDPWPRSPAAASIDESRAGKASESGRYRPFEALAALKRRK